MNVNLSARQVLSDGLAAEVEFTDGLATRSRLRAVGFKGRFYLVLPWGQDPLTGAREPRK